MAGQQMEWHQTHGNHLFNIFDTIPLILLESLTRACAPIKVTPTSFGTVEKHLESDGQLNAIEIHILYVEQNVTVNGQCLFSLCAVEPSCQKAPGCDRPAAEKSTVMVTLILSLLPDS